ncbi:hypothetical protein MATL_G00227890 [Megalops atlanticus]|uniref:Collagen alpha-1(XXVIII) chain n=1 Tax=Megalops atlanticus TaxID=7932 RepID=A0A9D3PD28_MEGAT|nr:hypothetical protein MATL_G00227890 [Megalops atlanticus]
MDHLAHEDPKENRAQVDLLVIMVQRDVQDPKVTVEHLELPDHKETWESGFLDQRVTRGTKEDLDPPVPLASGSRAHRATRGFRVRTGHRVRGVLESQGLKVSRAQTGHLAFQVSQERMEPWAKRVKWGYRASVALRESQGKESPGRRETGANGDSGDSLGPRALWGQQGPRGTLVRLGRPGLWESQESGSLGPRGTGEPPDLWDPQERKGRAMLGLRDSLGCQDHQESRDLKEGDYLEIRETEVPRAFRDHPGRQELGCWDLRVLWVSLGQLDLRAHPERAFRDRRGSLDFRACLAPGAPQVKAYLGKRETGDWLETEGRKERKGKLGHQEHQDPRGGRDRRGTQREEVIQIIREICGCGIRCRELPLELVFVIDSSESVGPDNFALVKGFVNALIERLSVSREATRVGVVLYSHITTVVLSLQQLSNQDEVKAAVRRMAYLGEGTYTGSAIRTAVRLFQAARPGVRRVAVVLTDGQADRRDPVGLEEAVREAHAARIEMFVIGVVNRSDPLYAEFQSEMNAIASDPDREHVYLIDDFMTLPALESKLLSRICVYHDGSPFRPTYKSFLAPSPAYTPETYTPPFTGDYDRFTKEAGPPERPTQPQDPKLGVSFHVDHNVTEKTAFNESINTLTDVIQLKPHPPVTSVTDSYNLTNWQYLPETTQPPPDHPAPPLTQEVFIPAIGCDQVLDPGPCRQYVVKWYYDSVANSCAQFWFGGCEGNQNQFETESSCVAACVRT